MLRLGILDHGFPDVNEEATPVRQAWEMWDWDSGGVDLNPRFFHYPALSFYANFLAQAGYRIVTESLGTREWGPVDHLPVDLVIIGRLISILCLVGMAAGTYLAGRRLMPNGWACWGPVIILWMPMLVRYSTVSVVDLPLGLFAALTVREIAGWPRNETLRHHVLVGLWVGLAAASKYTGALLALPYILLQLQSVSWHPVALFRRTGPYAAGAVSVLVFLALNPYIVLDFPTFLNHFSFEREHMTLGHFGMTEGPAVVYGRAFWENLGPILLACVPLAILHASRTKRQTTWIPLIGFVLLFCCLLVLAPTGFGHYLIPVLPAAVLVAISGMRFVVLSLRLPIRLSGRRLAPLLAIVPLLWWSGWRVATIVEIRPRTLAKQWIEENVAPGTIIAIEGGGPRIVEPWLALIVPMHSTNPAQSTPVYSPHWYDPIDYFLVVEGVENRYRAAPERFPDQVALYEYLASSWELVSEHRGVRRPGIRIYKNPAETENFPAYPDSIYVRLGGMDVKLAERFLDRLATAFSASGNLALAGDVYNRIVRYFPDKRDYALSYADILIRLGKNELALRLLKSRRKDADDYFLASLHYLKGDLDSAAVVWAHLAGQRPRNIPIRLNLARIYLSLEDWDRALRWYLEAIDRKVDEIEPYLQTCELLAATGDTQRILAVASMGLVKWPGNDDLRRWATLTISK